MEHKEMQAWLEGLKVGDEVIAESGYGYKVERVANVVSTTATIIRVTSGYTHSPHTEYRRKDGIMRGGEWHQRIRPLTPAAAERIERRRLTERLATVKWGSLPLEALRQVAALVGYKAEG